MEEEASGSSDRLSLNARGELAGAAVDSDDIVHQVPAQSHPDVLDSSVYLATMADRRGRGCSNIQGAAAQPRSANQQHRRPDDQAGGVPEARNRHRDRNVPNSGRQRPATSGSTNQLRAAAEVEPMADDSSHQQHVSSADSVPVAMSNDLTLLPVLQSDFVQDALSSSTRSWQVCC